MTFCGKYHHIFIVAENKCFRQPRHLHVWTCLIITIATRCFSGTYIIWSTKQAKQSDSLSKIWRSMIYGMIVFKNNSNMKWSANTESRKHLNILLCFFNVHYALHLFNSGIVLNIRDCHNALWATKLICLLWLELMTCTTYNIILLNRNHFLTINWTDNYERRNYLGTKAFI